MIGKLLLLSVLWCGVIASCWHQMWAFPLGNFLSWRGADPDADLFVCRCYQHIPACPPLRGHRRLHLVIPATSEHPDTQLGDRRPARETSPSVQEGPPRCGGIHRETVAICGLWARSHTEYSDVVVAPPCECSGRGLWCHLVNVLWWLAVGLKETDGVRCQDWKYSHASFRLVRFQKNVGRSNLCPRILIPPPTKQNSMLHSARGLLFIVLL